MISNRTLSSVQMSSTTKSESESEGNPDDLTCIKTEDSICLSSSVHIAKGKSYLAVRIGSNICYAQPEPCHDKEPSGIRRFAFKIEEAISVHAIHGWKKNEKQGGRRTLLYGQAVMLSAVGGKILRCLTYDAYTGHNVSDKDKHMNYQIGFFPIDKKVTIDAYCWFTVHPATKRRSDGEKVQAGDELYFVNVGTKRYLSVFINPDVDAVTLQSGEDDDDDKIDLAVATFSPWSWKINIITSGDNKEKFAGYLNGGDVIQLKLLHGKEELISVPLPKRNNDPLSTYQRRIKVCLEEKPVCLELRSLWIVDLFTINYGEGFVRWGQPFRLYHLSSGKFLAIGEREDVTLVDSHEADKKQTAFAFVKKSKPRDHSYIEPGMGKPKIKFGESEVLLYHINSDKWVGQEIIGRSLKRRPGVLHSSSIALSLHDQPPQNTTFTLALNYTIALSASLACEMETCMKGLAAAMGRDEEMKEVKEVVMEKSLSKFHELTVYLRPPNKAVLEMHAYQSEIMRLKNRQTRLHYHGTVKMTFALLQRSATHYSMYPTPSGLEIQISLCNILAAMVKENQLACKEFASEKCLDTVVKLLNMSHLTHAMLDVVHCLLEESPEMLCALTENHISEFVNLLHANGRDHKVMRLLGTLCVCQGVAMRDKQQQICRHLMKSRDLLLHTSLHFKVYSLYANVFIDTTKTHKMYYEFHWSIPKSAYSSKYHLRVGTALFQLFRPYPRSNSHCVSGGSIGDDFASIGFDGKDIWLGGNHFSGNSHQTVSSSPKVPRLSRQQSTSVDIENESGVTDGVNVIGCCIDLHDNLMWYTMNGREIPLRIKYTEALDQVVLSDFVIVPAVSFSGGIERAELRFGGKHGDLHYKPPEGYSPIYLYNDGEDIQLRPFLDLGDVENRILNGPQIIAGEIPFIPSVIDTSQIDIPDALNELLDQLAVNIHELWAFRMITDGWSYGEHTDINKKVSSGLKPYSELDSEDQWSCKKAHIVVTTLLALGCNISESVGLSKHNLKYQKIPPEEYRQSNGYLPHPLAINNDLPLSLMKLTNRLAENAHNHWAEEKLEQGWTYGISTRSDAKRSSILIPFYSLEYADRQKYRDYTTHSLNIILALGYNIRSPLIYHISEDDTYTQIPFRTFRGQFAPYCMGHGKWCYKVKLLKGHMMRIGWVTPGFSPSSLLGSDTHSYAIDGFQACKWHEGGSEKFGQRWKEEDEITCLIDLDKQTMSFARGNQLLQSPSGDTVAFRGFPSNQMYVPAVSLFLTEQVKIELDVPKVETSNLVVTGYEPIEMNIKSRVPLWYSDDSPTYEPISSSHPYLSLAPPTSSDTIMIETKDTKKQACLKLNMGVPILSNPAYSSNAPILEEGVVSFSVLIPATQNPKHVFIGWATPEIVYSPQFFPASLPDVLYINSVEILTPNEEKAWKVDTKQHTGFMVKLSGLIEGDNQVILEDMRVNCMLDVRSGEMTFTCSNFESHVTLKTTVPTKLYPMVITTPTQEMVCEFIFTSVDGCVSLTDTLLDSTQDQKHLFSSMEILASTEGCWHQMEDNCVPYFSSSSLSLPNLPSRKVIHVALPLEERVLGFAELVEFPDLSLFHLETLKTLKACCMLDNTEAGREVKNIFDWEQLLFCIEFTRWNYSLRAAYFNLFNTLHLEHEVNSRLLIKNDHIFAIESYQDIEHTTTRGRRSSFSQLILSNELSCGLDMQKCSKQAIPIREFKKLVFAVLERLLKTETLSCRMLTQEDCTNLLYPLLKALDSLLVLRLLNDGEDMDKLLEFLHPTFINTKEGLKPHHTLLTLSSHKSIRSILCNLMDHLCDCQLQSRVQHVIKFADNYVRQLQNDQRKRAEESSELSSRILQETNTPTEKQVAALLSFFNKDSKDCLTDVELQSEMWSFHSRLKSHCGVPDTHVSAKEEFDEQPSTFEKLRKLVNLVLQTSSNKKKRKYGSRVLQLQGVIKSTLLKWTREGIEDVKLVEQVFSLLFRQFNETDELVKALSHTYVVEKVSEFSSDGILEFQNALGYVKNLLKIGMGEEEEQLLERMLKTLQHSELFSRHPDLLRLTGVHTTVMNVIKSYLSYNTSLKQQSDVMHIRLERKKRMTLSTMGFFGPVEECCKFLCAFANTSRQNQCALFEHVPYLLEQCCNYPDQLSNDSCSPLDVARATILNNLDLVLELSEEIFKNVMQLMESMTMSYGGGGDESDSTSSDLGMSRRSPSSSVSMEWSPYGSEKCLKFLHAAVWVNGDTVLQNSSIIIKYLIQYPDSLGPGSLGQNLGLVSIFRDSLSLLCSNENKTSKTSKFARQTTIVKIEKETKFRGTMKRSGSSLLNLNSLTADVTLSFYTFLVRLLACCTRPSDSSHDSGCTHSSSNHIKPFLRSLISIDDLKTILCFPLCTQNKEGISPKQKEAILMFLDRVYTVETSQFLIELIKNVFIQDVNAALCVCKGFENKYTLVYFFRYICQYALPFLERHAHLIYTCSNSEISIITEFMIKCYRLANYVHVSNFHGKKIDSFLVTLTKTLPPQSILRLIPDLSTNITTNSMKFNTAVQVLTAHYQHYRGYYSSGMLSSTYKLHPPGRLEKTFIALLFSRLLHTASNRPSSEKSSIIECLKSLVSSITPECLIPSLDATSVMLNRTVPHKCDDSHSSHTSEVGSEIPRPSHHGNITTSSCDGGSHDSHTCDEEVSKEEVKIKIPSEVSKCIESFAQYCHERWIYEKQQVLGWSYGPEYDESNYKDPCLKPFDKLDKQDQLLLMKPAERFIQELLLWGYMFTYRNPLPSDSIPIKPQLLCIRIRPKKNRSENEDHFETYIPSVMDLNKIQFNTLMNYQVIAESAAVLIDDLLHVCCCSEVTSRYNPFTFLYREGHDETCRYIIDLLKYFQVKGLFCSGAFNALSGHILKNINPNSVEQVPFGQQLFQMFLSSVETHCPGGNCSCWSKQQVLYPVISHYLECHASYFNPMIGDKECCPTFASSAEKVQIARILNRFHIFLSHHVNKVISTPNVAMNTDTSLANNLSLGDLQEFNTLGLQQIMNLSLALLNAIDTNEEEVLEEVSTFFQSLTGLLEDFPEAVEKEANNQSNLFNMKFLLYCLYCVIPMLRALFSQFCENSKTVAHHSDIIIHCANVFNSIYIPTKKHTHVFVQSGTLSSVGQCLAIISQLYTSDVPVSEHLHVDSEIFGLSKNQLVQKLQSAAAKRLSSDKTAFVSSVVVPMLVSTLRLKSSTSRRQIDQLLKLTLRVVCEYQDDVNAEWMYTLCDASHKLAANCSISILSTHILPLLVSLSERSKILQQNEQLLYSSLAVRETDLLNKQREHNKHLRVFSRDIASILMFLITFCSTHHHKDIGESAMHDMFNNITPLLDYWFSSQRFVNRMGAFIKQVSNATNISSYTKYYVDNFSNPLLLFFETLFRFIPLAYKKIIDQFQNLFSQTGQTIDDIERTIADSLKSNATVGDHFEEEEDKDQEDKDEEDMRRKREHLQKSAHIVRVMSYTRYYLQQNIGAHSHSTRGRWKQLLSKQKRESILLCLKAVPFYKLKRHRAVNLFLNEYCKTWLSDCTETNMERICEQLLDQEDYETNLSNKSVQRHDPLTELFSTFKTLASAQQWESVCGSLYYSYITTIVKTTQWMLEEEEEKEGESVAKAYERFHRRLALATTKQEQLLRREVTYMLLAVLTASQGTMCPLVHVTIQLGLILLEGGNQNVQEKLLSELNSMDASFFISMEGLVLSCSVLNWSSYERHYMSIESCNNIAEKVFPSSDEVIDLFRFLQLLCEGHNEAFQNYLRTQERSRTTTVNIVIATVDYLLKLQESVRDFYWHHAHQDMLELPARESFLVAFKVTRQVFRTLTEYIQGPCAGNQQALAKSRLWDAVSGYLHIFTSLQQKLFRHTNHIELLRDMLDLQEEFFILLISMLEGSTMSSSIGHHMINMLLECENHVKALVTFYTIFIKLADVTTSNAFKEYDLNKDGFISYREFEKAMLSQQHYTKSEIDYLMQVADTNKDGLLDYKEFTERFHQPAHNLGFHLCALIQQLSDILPHDQRVVKFRGLCQDLFHHFEGNMGCVEIIGKSQQVERVYFRIKNSRAEQWNKVTIKDSRKNFVYNLELSSQREKLEKFVNFCENTIFEMNYNDTLTGIEQEEQLKQAEQHRLTHYPAAANRSFTSQVKGKLTSLRETSPTHPILKLEAFLMYFWMFILFGIIIKPAGRFVHFIWLQLAFLWHKGEGPLRPRTNFHSHFRLPVLNNYLPHIVYSLHSFGAILATNYFKIKFILMVTTILINFLILFTIEESSFLSIADGFETCSIIKQTLHWFTYIHFILSFILIFSFWNQKVPLILFKHEKKVAQRLEQQKLFSRKMSLSFLDQLIIKSSSFPRHFWDKQIKERVLYRVSSEEKEIVANILGMEMWSKYDQISKKEQFIKMLSDIIDIRYHIWYLIVVFKEPQVLYHIGYCLLSLAGLRWNIFYFSIHLLHFMLQSQTLITVLRSLQVHRKQLMMTLAMTVVVIYIYTIIGFIFFRKFYRHEMEEGIVQDNCDTMWNCFFFHLDKGLRSGGGIADVLVPATGDQNYFLRLSFDMTFFFVVIVMLLAIFQGLIIDAFGELRKKEDIITDELKRKCFICGISKIEFSSPHEYDNHIHHHHAMRDYMFFMMHLIGKPETEFTGQESYVWEQYLEQKWDFFPAGTCFQLQEKQRQLAKEKQVVKQQKNKHQLLLHAHTLATI